MIDLLCEDVDLKGGGGYAAFHEFWSDVIRAWWFFLLLNVWIILMISDWSAGSKLKLWMLGFLNRIDTLCKMLNFFLWLIKLTRGVCKGLPCYVASPENCFVFWKRQPWFSLADVTLLVVVHKCLLNFWFKRVEDYCIRVSQIVKTKSGVLLTFV